MVWYKKQYFYLKREKYNKWHCNLKKIDFKNYLPITIEKRNHSSFYVNTFKRIPLPTYGWIGPYGDIVISLIKNNIH